MKPYLIKSDFKSLLLFLSCVSTLENMQLMWSYIGRQNLLPLVRKTYIKDLSKTNRTTIWASADGSNFNFFENENDNARYGGKLIQLANHLMYQKQKAITFKDKNRTQNNKEVRQKGREGQCLADWEDSSICYFIVHTIFLFHFTLIQYFLIISLFPFLFF